MKTYLFISANKNKSSFFKQNYHQRYFWFKIHQPLLVLIIICICNSLLMLYGEIIVCKKYCVSLLKKNFLLDSINK